jgi:hypothetical protein
MSAERDNSGPAFPVEKYGATGMTLRDYAAIHSTQPGMIELAKAAGVGIDRQHRVYVTADTSAFMHFDDWWLTMTIERQFELCALVRYAQADAMLKARKT